MDTNKGGRYTRKKGNGKPYPWYLASDQVDHGVNEEPSQPIYLMLVRWSNL